MVTRLLVPVLLFAALAVSSCGGTNDAPTNVGQTTATLNATVSCDGGNRKVYSDGPGEPCAYYLYTQIKGSGDPWTIRSSADDINEPVNNLALHVDVTGLRAGTTYVTGLCGKGDAVRTWQCPSSLVREFTTQQAGSTGDDTAVPAAPSGWTRVGAEGFASQSGAFPSSFTQYPATWKDTSKQGTYGCAGGTLVSGGIFGFNLVGGQVCAPVFKTQGGSGTLGNGMPAGMTEGRYSVRFRVRSGASSAHKIAWLLWPDSDVWADGEIDFPEVSQFPDEIKGFLHHPGANVATDQDAYDSGVTAGTDNAWHVATVERRAGSVKFFMDGNLLGTSTDRLPTKAMHWVLQSETRVNSTSVPPSSATTDIDVDWVTVDKPSGTNPPPPAADCANGQDDDGDGKVDLADPGCSSASDTDETDPAPPPPPGSGVYSLVGDFCGGSCGAVATLVKSWNVVRHLGAGDYQYNDGRQSTFDPGYGSKFAGLHGITIPTFGSTHDTNDGSGSWEGYPVSFFNTNGAPEVRGQLSDHQRGYIVDLPNDWRVAVLNYNNQDTAWVQQQLAGRANRCTMALVHAPVYGSPSSEHPTNQSSGFASVLAAAGTDVIGQGHQHFYERLTQPSGVALTVGTGGIGPYTRTSTASGSVFYRSGTYGAVRLTLGANSWKSEFISTAGTVIDTAQGNCAD